MASKGRRR